MAYTGTGVNGICLPTGRGTRTAGDTGGIALDDWTNVNTARQAILHRT